MLSLRALVVNGIIGVVILFIANAVGLGVQISVVTVLVCAVFGVPGALVVLVLAWTNIAFAAALVPAIAVDHDRTLLANRRSRLT